MTNIRSLTWSAASLDDAVGALALAADLAADAAETRHRVEVRAVDAAVSDLGALCQGGAPLVLRLVIDGDERVVCVLGARRTRLHVLAPDGTRQRIDLREVARWLPPADGTSARAADFLMQSIAGGRALTQGQRSRIAAFTGADRVCAGWTLRRHGGGWRPLARDTRVEGHLWRFVTLHAVQYGLWLAASIVLLQLALHADFGAPDLVAWTLAMATLALARAWQGHSARVAALCGGTAIKRRLLDAALELNVDRIRHAGVGHFLGRVLEGEAIESAGLAGAFQATNAIVGAAIALFVLAHGAGGWAHAALLAAWIGAIATGSTVYYGAGASVPNCGSR